MTSGFTNLVKMVKIIKVLIKKNRKTVIHSMLALSCSSSTLNAFLADLRKTHFSLTLDYQVLFKFDLDIHHSPCLFNIHLSFLHSTNSHFSSNRN